MKEEDEEKKLLFDLKKIRNVRSKSKSLLILYVAGSSHEERATNKTQLTYSDQFQSPTTFFCTVL